MERKLIGQGKGGLTVYLPKKWIDKKGLKGGDSVKITETNTNLVIGSQVREKREASFEMNDEIRTQLKEILTHLYRRGFDKMTFSNCNAESIKIIQNVTSKYLLGFDITDRTKDRCVIENISEPADERYEVMLRRVFLINQEMIELIAGDFDGHSFSNMAEVESLKEQLDKFCLFCRRLLVKEQYERDSLFEWELLTFLMHIVHTLYYMYKYASEHKLTKDIELQRLFKELKNYFALFYDSYYKRDIKAIYKINSSKGKYQFGSCLEAIEKSKGHNAIIASYIREVFRIIQIGTSPILSELLKEELFGKEESESE